MFSVLIIAGLVALALACRSFNNRYLAKAGWLIMLAATYLAGYALFGGSHVAGAAALSCWFLLPWVEILGRVRRLRFPLSGEISHRFPPSAEVFPELDDLTEEVVSAGFKEQDDTGWKWDETDHFMRLFYHPGQKVLAAIGLAQQGNFAVSYVSVTSRAADGHSYTTSNYPFSYSMQFSPEHHVRRFEGAESFEELLAEHHAFLASSGMNESDVLPLDAEHLDDYIEHDMEQQIEHNIKVGVLEPAADGEKIFRYSWRGCIFLWLQIVKDMIRV